MQLKKINPNLQKALIENDFIEANELQQETFSTIKSGVDAVIQSPNGSGKTTTIFVGKTVCSTNDCKVKLIKASSL